MMIKINKILTFAAAALLLSGCSSIDPDERFIEVEAVTPKRAVLLEEFTGQYCTNCPSGHDIAASLVKQYGDAFIPVSIHGGPLSIAAGSIPGIEGLAVPDGETYYNNAGSPNLPCGIVDGKGSPIEREDWSEAVRKEFETEAPAAIDVVANYSQGNIGIDVTVKPTADFEGRMQVWLTESGIVSLQVNKGDYVFDYVHNHVFRAAVNGINGDPVSVSRNVFLEKSFSIATDSNWKPENMEAVVFIRNSSGVLQAAKAKVTVTGTEE